MGTSVIPRRGFLAAMLGLALAISLPNPVPAQTDPLPSWNDGAVKAAIVDFVRRTTTTGSPDFIPAEDRIATFDNDGTLWTEQPVYVQAAFAVDRIKVLAKDHPEWKATPPFAAILAEGEAALSKLGQRDLLAIVSATHAGMSVAEFDTIVRTWMATARHPRFDRPYTGLVYQPMIELLSYLRANGFSTFIVSGGGIEFMRPWAPGVYGIPPQQIVGSSGKTEFKLDGNDVSILKLPDIEFVDDGPGKPVGINRFIGKRPVFAAGNSDGDLQMLQWTTLNSGARFGLIVHHTDAEREWAYDRQSHVGRLDKALDEAPSRGWEVVDMKRDWKVIFPPGK